MCTIKIQQFSELGLPFTWPSRLSLLWLAHQDHTTFVSDCDWL